MMLTAQPNTQPTTASATPIQNAVQAGAVPAVAVFEVADATFGAGAPFHEPSERALMFDGSSRLGRLALAGDDDRADAEVCEVTVDAGFAVTSVGGDRPWRFASARFDPPDSGSELRRVTDGSHLDAVIEDDTVVVVDHLGLVAELGGPVDAAFADRSSVRVVQAD